MKKSKLICLLLVAVLVFSFTACGGKNNDPSGDSNESNWPQSSVNLYVPATAGGATDMLARLFAQAASEASGGTFVVINDMTGGGTVATETVRNASTDGTDLLLTNAGLFGKIASGQYDKTIDDFTLLGLTTSQGQESGGIYVSAKSDFETLDDLIAYAKENPGELLSGIQNGSSSHYMQALFEEETGIETTMVDAGANADRIAALIGGTLDLSIMNNTGVLQYVEAGDLRCLVQLDQPSLVMPEIPTMEDFGYEPCSIDNVTILLGPKGMSEEDVLRIEEILKECNVNEDLMEGYEKLGAEWVFMPVEEARVYLDFIQGQFNEAYKLLQARGLA